MKLKPLVVLVSVSLGGCATEMPMHQSYYGVDQVIVQGRPQYVLCNPCVQPSVKRPSEPNSTAALQYGDSVEKLARYSHGSVLSMAMTLNAMGVPIANNMLTRTPPPAGTPKKSSPDMVAKAPVTKDANDSKIATDVNMAEITSVPMPEPLQAGTSTAKGDTVPDDAAVYRPQAEHDENSKVDKERKPDITGSVQSVSKQQMVTVRFGHDSYELTTDAMDSLTAVVNSADKAERIAVRGFTDAIGHKAYNDWLAKARMESVENWLLDRGIDKAKIIAKPDESQGACCYIADNATPQGRANNRRVEVVAKYEDSK